MKRTRLLGRRLPGADMRRLAVYQAKGRESVVIAAKTLEDLAETGDSHVGYTRSGVQ